MSDDQLDEALSNFSTDASSADVADLLKTMNDHNIIQWDEAQKIIDETQGKIVKCGLPEQQRPSEPENTTDVDYCIQRLMANDPAMTEVNINNMKRTPIPQIQKLIWSIRENNYIRKLSMSNTGIMDNAVGPLVEALQSNTSLQVLNLETNFLSGEFLKSLFQALLKNQTVEEVRATNQGVTMSNQAEIDIANAINENNTLRKVGLNFRRHESRNQVDHALYRNSEMQRLMRMDDSKIQEMLDARKAKTKK